MPIKRYVVAGIGTEVGKTVVSTILALKHQIGYWKPIECGDSDSKWVKQFVNNVYEPAFRFKKPSSPHNAADEEGKVVDNFALPTENSLVIEMVGGIFVPLRNDLLSINQFAQFDAKWIVVSKMYLGSINHTLLTLEALHNRGISVSAVIFNGKPNQASEKAILQFSQIAHFERLIDEKKLDKLTLQKYVNQWKI